MSVIYFCVGPGGGVLPYISHMGMCGHRAGFLRRFGLKIGMHFADFGLESGWVFEGTTRVYEHFYPWFQFQMSKKERKICEFEIDLNNFCVCALIQVMIT